MTSQFDVIVLQQVDQKGIDKWFDETFDILSACRSETKVFNGESA